MPTTNSGHESNSSDDRRSANGAHIAVARAPFDVNSIDSLLTVGKLDPASLNARLRLGLLASLIPSSRRGAVALLLAKGDKKFRQQLTISGNVESSYKIIRSQIDNFIRMYGPTGYNLFASAVDGKNTSQDDGRNFSGGVPTISPYTFIYLTTRLNRGVNCELFDKVDSIVSLALYCAANSSLTEQITTAKGVVGGLKVKDLKRIIELASTQAVSHVSDTSGILGVGKIDPDLAAALRLAFPKLDRTIESETDVTKIWYYVLQDFVNEVAAMRQSNGTQATSVDQIDVSDAVSQMLFISLMEITSMTVSLADGDVYIPQSLTDLVTSSLRESVEQRSAQKGSKTQGGMLSNAAFWNKLVASYKNLVLPDGVSADTKASWIVKVNATCASEALRTYARNKITPAVEAMMMIESVRSSIHEFLTDVIASCDNAFSSVDGLLAHYAAFMDELCSSVNESSSEGTLAVFQSAISAQFNLVAALEGFTKTGMFIDEKDLAKALSLFKGDNIPGSGDDALTSLAISVGNDRALSRADSKYPARLDVCRSGGALSMVISDIIKLPTLASSGGDMTNYFSMVINKLLNDATALLNGREVTDAYVAIKPKELFRILALSGAADSNVRNGIRSGAYSAIGSPWQMTADTKGKMSNAIGALGSCVSLVSWWRILSTRLCSGIHLAIARDIMLASKCMPSRYWEAFAALGDDNADGADNSHTSLDMMVSSLNDMIKMLSLPPGIESMLLSTTTSTSLPDYLFVALQKDVTDETFSRALVSLVSCVSSKATKARVSIAFSTFDAFIASLEGQSLSTTRSLYNLPINVFGNSVSSFDVAEVVSGKVPIDYKARMTPPSGLRSFLKSYCSELDGSIKASICFPLTNVIGDTTFDGSINGKKYLNIIGGSNYSADIVNGLTVGCKSLLAPRNTMLHRSDHWSKTRVAHFANAYGVVPLALSRFAEYANECHALGLFPEYVDTQVSSSKADMDSVLEYVGLHSSAQVSGEVASIIYNMVAKASMSDDSFFPFECIDTAVFDHSKVYRLDEVIQLRDRLVDKSIITDRRSILLYSDDDMIAMFDDYLFVTQSVETQVLTHSPFNGFKRLDPSDVYIQYSSDVTSYNALLTDRKCEMWMTECRDEIVKVVDDILSSGLDVSQSIKVMQL